MGNNNTMIGTSGQVLMSSSTSSTFTWGNTTPTTTSPWTVTTGTGPYTIRTDPNIKGSSLLVGGDAEFEGDVKIKGKSLTELIDNIEQRLAILHPNEKLEAKWEKLKKLGDEYREMEKDILHSEEMWKILNK
jgi:hypothetical protein